MGRMFWRGLTIAALVAWLVGDAHAQMSTGAIAGTVTDNSGGVLPGVTISLTGARLDRRHTDRSHRSGRHLPLRPAAAGIL